MSKKRKDAKAVAADEAAGCAEQEALRAVLVSLRGMGRFMDWEAFVAELAAAARRAEVKLSAPLRKAIFAALGERDP